MLWTNLVLQSRSPSLMSSSSSWSYITYTRYEKCARVMRNVYEKILAWTRIAAQQANVRRRKFYTNEVLMDFFEYISTM